MLGGVCVYYLCELDGLLLTLRVFPEHAGSTWFSLLAENRAAQSREVLLSSFFNPVLRHQLYDTDEDRWFREIRVAGDARDGSRLFHLRVNEDKDRYTSIAHHYALQRTARQGPGVSLLDEQCTTSRYDYMGGPERNLSNSLPLHTGRFQRQPGVTTFTEPAVAGDLLRLALQPDASAQFDHHFFAAGDEPWKDGATNRAPQPDMVDKLVRQAERYVADGSTPIALLVSTSSREAIDADTFTAFLGHLQTQVEFCALMKGYAQLSENSLIGIRDVFQAIEGLLYWRPEAARAKMLEALSYTCVDGRCFRQYALPHGNGTVGRMDLRPFIDQGCWVISTVATYLRVTGDLDFLDEECGYHEIVSEEARRVRPARERGTVLEHLIRITEYLLANRAEDTGAIRALYGDWNDALDGLGTLPDGSPGYGDGVSVMATLQVLQNLCEMQDILSLRPSAGASERSASYARAKTRLAESLERYAVQNDPAGARRIVHGWGHGRSYFVGSRHDVDGLPRDSLTANAFWILAGMLERDPSMRGDILAAFSRLDSKYGLKTFEPAFAENVRGVGRIGKLPPGTAENGATYIHATAFAVMALFEMGEPELAWDQLEKILPFTPIHGNLSHSPFVMPNSYGHFPEKGIDGQNMNDWQTGSSNVLLKAIIRYVIGFSPGVEGIRIQPAAYCPFERWTATLPCRRHRMRIEYLNTARGSRSFHVNGARAPSTPHPVMGIEMLEIPFDALSLQDQTIHITIED